jgi:class 3 adenylate cyclase
VALTEAAPVREMRKVVSVVFCDLTGSTALGERTDPEALRTRMRGYYERMRQILERHGGTVEKFVGDAVMAVFGVPVAHEDDALRAVRAAWEMRAAVIRLGLQARIGVNTGEVVAGEGDTLVTGDAVNVAARLEQLADTGEVLIGGETRQLVRDAVQVEPVQVAAKGKAEPVAAYRLLNVDLAAAAVARRLDTPLIGRRFELQQFRQAFERSVRERRCHLFTVLGAAGVGKSRLAAEFLCGLDATTLSGRCLEYGEGITFWPVVSVLKQLGERAEETIARIVDGAFSSNELFWNVRSQFEKVAHERPLVVVFDDVQWGEETFLDLIDHVADLSRDAPLLLLCLARPDLLDKRPTWGGGKLNATTILLEPLTAEECAELIDVHGGAEPGTRERIVASADGNPLFVEEMLALVRESDDVRTPSTVQALLQARLDQLARGERTVIEGGAIEGEIFHRSAVVELARSPDVASQLVGLVRKELIHPAAPTLSGDEAFRFRHLLFRDAAYQALPKQTRAELHERFADWLEVNGRELIELDEVLGYHLEQAARYRRELDRADPELERRAGRHLATAGSGAVLRSDAHGRCESPWALARAPSARRSPATVCATRLHRDP